MTDMCPFLFLNKQIENIGVENYKTIYKHRQKQGNRNGHMSVIIVEHTTLFMVLSLRNKDIYIVDVAEWSRVMNIRPSEWCCSVSMV
jgi:HD superfamily phosphohydrolase YqeK